MQMSGWNGMVVQETVTNHGCKDRKGWGGGGGG